MFDLAIVGGEVVTGHGRARLNLAVRDGVVAAATDDTPDARESVDASGLLVLPGMVDVHVHAMDPADPTREDFPTVTAAAAAAGVTTLVEHTHAAPVRTADDLGEKRTYVQGRSRVDFALGAHAWPEMFDAIPGVWRAGAAFIKAFTCTTHGVPGFVPSLQLELCRAVAACDAIALVHCEDETITQAAEERLRSSGRVDGAVIPEWRCREAEYVAIASLTRLAHVTGARVVVAHVSHGEALELVLRERRAGANVHAESCPQYLTIFEREVNDELGFRKFTPPARARSQHDLDRMWTALDEGEIDYIATDHAPATAEHKRDGSIWDVHFGLPGVDTTLAVLLDGAAAGRISYERVVSAYAEQPARLYRLAGKGGLSPGADADIVLVDPAVRWTVADGDIRSKAGWSPLAGRTLTGKAVRVYQRGVLIADEGRVLAEPGTGRFVPGPGARS
jgi:dihydroorotase (multifunctional complex type)